VEVLVNMVVNYVVPYNAGNFLFAEKILAFQEEFGFVETFIWLVGYLLC
jgi:hypothetical protein